MTIRKALIFFIALILLLFISMVTFIQFADLNRYKHFLTDAVYSSTGRTLTIDGPLAFSLFDFPTLKVEQVSLSNADWAKADHIAKIKLLEVDMSLWALLKGDIEVNRLTLIEPDISLETSAEGNGNWELITQREDSQPSNEPASLPLISLDNIQIKQARFLYMDGVSHEQYALNIEEMSLTQKDSEHLFLTVSGRYQTLPFTLSATTGQVMSLLRNQRFPVDIKLVATDEAEITMAGMIDTPLSRPTVSVSLAARLDDLKQTLGQGGITLPALPPIALRADIAQAESKVALQHLDLQLGESDLSGQLTVEWRADRPTIHAELRAIRIDTTQLITADELDEQAQIDTTLQNAPVNSEESPSIPFDVLKDFDADLDLAIGTLILPDLSLDDVHVASHLDEGVLILKPISLLVDGGVIESTLALNTNKSVPTIEATLTGNDVSLSSLPQVDTYASGHIQNLALSLNTEGQTVEQLLEHIHGTLTLKANETNILAASWSAVPELAKVADLALTAEFDLAEQQFDIKQLQLLQPRIALETNTEGDGNWIVSQTEAAAPPTEQETSENDNSPLLLTLNNVLIEDGQFGFVDTQGMNESIRIKQFTLNATESSELALSLQSEYKDEQVVLSGQVGALSQLLANQTFPVELFASVNEKTRFSFKGTLNSPLSEPNAAGTVKADIPKLSTLSSLARTALPELPPITLVADLTQTPSQVDIKHFQVTQGNSDLSGDLSLAWNETPQLSAHIKSLLIDLTELPSNDSPPAKSTDKVFPSTPLPLDWLEKGQVDLALSAEAIKTNAATLHDVNLVSELENGVFKLKPVSLDVADGHVSGEATLTHQQDQAVLTSQFAVTNLNPQKITPLKDYVTEGAQTDISLSLNGQGSSIAAIMAEANGQLLIQSKPGHLNVEGGILTAELLTSLIPLSSQQQGMNLECGVVNYTVKEGIATADKGIAIVTDKMFIVGSSLINLKTEKLGVKLKPRVREGLGISVTNLADLVHIGGTLSKPSVGADLTSTITTGLKVQSAIATGGLSLLASKLFDEIIADDDPCSTALGKEPVPEPASSTD